MFSCDASFANILEVAQQNFKRHCLASKHTTGVFNLDK